ncbi:MAG: hypothetical protein AMJ78_09675 [Omnitrophica WOR_2 bacterium SM23_29]|nr:MAG: hypothetical protein AMJ78_09675 [Omnitrophica WOR_2 bacterium SM23_29]
MRLKTLGEVGLIERIAKKIKVDKTVIRGIGEDCAVIRLSKKKLLLLTIDMLIEGVHFKAKETSPFQIGWKSLACGISDIAAMGGVAEYAVVSLGLPAKLPVEFVDGIYKGIKSLGRRFDVKIIGGDTNSSKELVIDVAVLGFVEPRRLVSRSGAKIGDIVCVTGVLGGSYKSGRHLKFVPRLKEARALVKNYRVNSMIDLSDGLSTDLNHMAKESEVGACIYKELIPISKDASSFDAALNEGEDFELLFTLPLIEARRLAAKKPNGIRLPITQIGEIIDKKMGVKIIDRFGRVKELKPKGYRHF